MPWLEALFRQLNVIWDAPGPFLIVWAILTYAAYRFARHHFSERLVNMEGRLSLRDDEIASLKERHRKHDFVGTPSDDAAMPPAILAPTTPLKPATHSVQTETGPKEILDSSITPQQLMALCLNKTNLQASSLTSGYVGKWMRVEGSLGNVSEHEDRSAFASVEVPLEGHSYTATLWLSFSRPEPALAGFSRGDTLRALGKIEQIKETSMDLKDCELIV